MSKGYDNAQRNMAYKHLDIYVRQAIELLPAQGEREFHEYVSDVLDKARALIAAESELALVSERKP